MGHWNIISIGIPTNDVNNYYVGMRRFQMCNCTNYIIHIYIHLQCRYYLMNLLRSILKTVRYSKKTLNIIRNENIIECARRIIVVELMHFMVHGTVAG